MPRWPQIDLGHGAHTDQRPAIQLLTPARATPSEHPIRKRRQAPHFAYHIVSHNDF